METVTDIKNGKLNSTKKRLTRKTSVTGSLKCTCQTVPDTKLYRYCMRCGKLLKSMEARQLGYGPICAKKMEQVKRRLF